MKFFSDKVLLMGETAQKLYDEIKDLPIIDYHCHLEQKKIVSDEVYDDIGKLWLENDHYKWRAMRLCGIEERYITGDASWQEKFYKYASIMPYLCGNPLYYWTHLELKQIFGINEPLNEGTASSIYRRANELLKNLSVRKLLKNFNIEFVATTDDPCDTLEYNGVCGDMTISPTFRPDKLYDFSSPYIKKLGESANIDIKSLAEYKRAIISRLDYFTSKDCKIADHGFLDFPKSIAAEDEANRLFENIDKLSMKEKEPLFGYLLVFLMKEYKKRNIVAQLHFSVIRNINSDIYEKNGVDQGCDVIAKEADIYSLINLLNYIPEKERPPIILYSLNPNTLSALACLSGAFRNVYMGAAWWFNDTLSGIMKNLETISEYSCLGTHLGMLSDSRSFSGYVRFDFFRRILASFVGEKVDKGEFCFEDAEKLVKNISYYNIKKLLNI